MEQTSRNDRVDKLREQIAVEQKLVRRSGQHPHDRGRHHIKIAPSAGGFGNYLNIRHAIEIGMLPDIPLEKVHFVGNTSMKGARTVALSCQALQTAEKLAANMTYFDLMSHPGYMDEFIKSNFLPYTDLTLFPSVHCSDVSL